MNKIGWIFLVLLALQGCKKAEDCRPIPEGARDFERIPLERIDHVLKPGMPQTEVQAQLSAFPVFKDYFLDAREYPSEEELVEGFTNLLQQPSIDTLFKDVERIFGDFRTQNDELSQAFAIVKDAYPNFKIPKVQTAVTGLYRDILIQDSLVILGLDFFLGDESVYRPLEVPNYILQRYTPDHLSPTVLYIFSNSFIVSNEQDRSLLQEMINYGKAYYFLEQILPCKADYLLIGYTEQQMADVYVNSENIYAHFVENELWYETNPTAKSKYTGERPKVPEIADECPGRIGSWLGWEIVRAYAARNPQLSLQEIMEQQDARKIFSQSKYKPK